MTTEATIDLTHEQKALFDKLTRLRQRFAIGILLGKSQINSYLDGGGTAKGKTAYVCAHDLFMTPEVQEFIASVRHVELKAALVDRQEAMEILSDLARTSMTDLVEFGAYELGEDEDGRPIIQTAWKIKDSALQDPKALASIAELTAGKDGIKIKQHSRLQAIKQLTDMEGWNSATKVDLTNSDGSLKPQVIDASKLSTEALQELLAAKDTEE